MDEEKPAARLSGGLGGLGTRTALYLRRSEAKPLSVRFVSKGKAEGASRQPSALDLPGE